MLTFKVKYLVIKNIALKTNLIHTILTLRIACNEDKYDLRDMFMITSRRIIIHGAKKLLDNDVFLVVVKKTVLLCLLQWYFRVLMLKCNFWLTKQNNNEV